MKGDEHIDPYAELDALYALVQTPHRAEARKHYTALQRKLTRAVSMLQMHADEDFYRDYMDGHFEALWQRDRINEFLGKAKR